MSFSSTILIRVAMLFGFGALALMLWFAIARPIQVLPRMQPVSQFTLTDQTLRWVGDLDLRGRITLVSFGYSRCGAACADAELELRALSDQFSVDASFKQQVQILTISLDPEYDTPTMLRDYAQRLGADSDRWHLLTGSADEVKRLVGGNFGVYYTQKADGRVAIEQQVLLIDDTGLIRARYPRAVPDPVIIQRDINLLLRESFESHGSQRVIYEAAHLFVCYPQ
jgi:protein SCO1/2